MAPIDSIDHIVRLSGDVIRWLLTWSWQVCLLVCVAWIVLKLDRSHSPAVRYRIWLIAIIAVSALPLLTPISHSLHLSGAIAPFPVEWTGEAPTSRISPEVARPAFSWPSLVWPSLLALWATGVIISLLRLGNSLWQLYLIESAAQRVSMADLDCTYADLLHSDAGKVSIVLSESVQSPGLAGLFRPVILLPSDIALWTSREERASILRHELAHIKRRDHLVSLFQTSLRSLLFFHPLLRYGCDQLSQEREFACDDYVIGLGTDPKAYAESILKAVERSFLTDVVHQSASFASRRTLERRIEMILDGNRIRKPLKQWQSLWLPLMLIGVVTWLVIPAANSQPRLEGDISQRAQDESISNRVASPAYGQTQAPPVVERSTIWVDTVKRGTMLRQVRGLGVLVPADDGRLKAEIGIFEPQAKNLETGQTVSINTRESVIHGKVISINPRVVNNQVAVEVSLEGDLPKSIKAGLKVDGVIEVERLEDVLYIGRPIHGQADSTSTLFKLDDDGLTATRVVVKFGRSSVNTIEILEGLKAGDKVIVSDVSAYEGVSVIKLN